MAVRIDHGKCTRCEACITLCEAGALSMCEGKLAFAQERCTGCGECVRICANEALELVIDAVPTEVEPYIEPPGIVELQARPVARTGSSDLPAKRPSPDWLGILGRAGGALAAFIIDRSLGSGGTSGSGRQGAGSGQMRRMRRRGGR